MEEGKAIGDQTDRSDRPGKTERKLWVGTRGPPAHSLTHPGPGRSYPSPLQPVRKNAMWRT